VDSRFAPLVAPVALVAGWALLSATALAEYQFLPSPLDVATAFVDSTVHGDMLAATAHTVGMSLSASMIAIVGGGLLGLAIGSWASARRYSMATIDFLRTIPAIALVPVALLALGPIGTTELLLAVFAATWPVVINTAAGVASVHPRHHDVARTLHLSRGHTLRKVVVPAAIPAWLVGARLALVVGLLVTIVAEMLMYPRGLGGGLVTAFHALAPAQMWAYALLCGVLGVLLNAMVRSMVRHALPGSPALRTADRGASAAPVGAVLTPPIGLLPLAIGLVVWQLVAPVDSLSFPPPSEWIAALARLAREGTLATAVTSTLVTYLLGLAMATSIGTLIGASIGASARIDRSLTGTVDFVATIPAAVLVPLATLLIGPTLLAGVLVVGLIASLPISLSTATAMRSIPVVRMEMARSIGLGPLHRWSEVITPSLTPGVLLGVRVAASVAIIVTLLVDVFGTGSGIGRLLVLSQQHFDGAAAWGLLLIVGGFGYLSSVALTRLALTSRGTAPYRAAAAAPSDPARRRRARHDPSGPRTAS
jgi:sulfonate transport system permease protein